MKTLLASLLAGCALLLSLTEAQATPKSGYNFSYIGSDLIFQNDTNQGNLSRGGFGMQIDYQWPLGDYFSIVGRMHGIFQKARRAEPTSMRYVSLAGWDFELRAWLDRFYISTLGGASLLMSQESLTDFYYMAAGSTYYGYSIGYETPEGFTLAYQWKHGDRNFFENYPDVSFQGGTVSIGYRFDFNSLSEFGNLGNNKELDI